MKKQKLRIMAIILLGCMGFAACGGTADVYHEREDDSSSYEYEQEEDSSDVWEGKISEKPQSGTVTAEPKKVSNGVGNTAAALLKGGYYVHSKEDLYMADGAYIYRRDVDGNVEQVVYNSEGSIGYLNICGDYIYYMTNVDRGTLGNAKDDRTIYRKCLITSDSSEVVASGVTDYGMGYGIKNGELYCTMKEKITSTKYQYSFCKIDLNDLSVISSEANTRFVAVEDRALYVVNSDGEFICSHWGGEYSLGMLSADNYAFGRLPKHNKTWSFSIEKDEFYYVDMATYDFPCIMKVSPDGVEMLADLSSVGADYGTDLYAADKELFLNVGTISSQGYHKEKYVMVNLLGQISDCTRIEGKILYMFSTNWIIIYQASGGTYWSNKYPMPSGVVPGDLGSSLGTLLESNKSMIEALNTPSGMGFYVE